MHLRKCNVIRYDYVAYCQWIQDSNLPQFYKWWFSIGLLLLSHTRALDSKIECWMQSLHRSIAKMNRNVVIVVPLHQLWNLIYNIILYLSINKVECREIEKKCITIYNCRSWTEYATCNMDTIHDTSSDVNFGGAVTFFILFFLVFICSSHSCSEFYHIHLFCFIRHSHTQ